MSELEMFKQALNEGVSNHFDNLAGGPPGVHPLDELWEKSVAEQEALLTPSMLTPGGDCMGDGLHEGYACMCETGCDYQYECWENRKAELKKYGINFRVHDDFVKDFFALKEAWERGQKFLDCERSELDGDLRGMANAGWLSIDDVRYVERNFIYSDEGFRKAR